MTRRRWLSIVGAVASAGVVAAMRPSTGVRAWLPPPGQWSLTWTRSDGSRATVVSDLRDGSIGRDWIEFMPNQGYALMKVARL